MEDNMKKDRWSRFSHWAVLLGFIAIFLVLASVLGVPNGRSENPNAGPNVVPSDMVVYGRTYSEWSAAWEQWADSIPVDNHPLFDNGDCSVGQSGPVWFLGGKFCANNGTNCGTNNVVRSCKVPHGKALYVAVFNSEDSTLEDPARPQIADLRAFAAGNMEGTANLSMTVDGAPIPNLKDRFRIQSPAFVFTLPDKDFLTAVGEGPFTAGSYFPGVDDGVYVMLEPLPLGHHTIHFHGEMPAFNFVLDITYHMYVYR
jgi:hypothetical protein